MLLSAFLWCIDNITKNSSSFYISPTLAIIFKFRNRQHTKNNIRYKRNINNTSSFFLNRKSKTPSDVTLLGRTSEDVFVMLAVVLHFIFDLHFVFVSSFVYLHFGVVSSFVVFLHSHFLFDVIPHPSVDYRRVFTPILYFQPSSLQSDPRHFHFLPFRYLLAESTAVLSGLFLSQAFFTLRSFTNILTCVYQGFPFFSIIITMYFDSLVTNILKTKVNKTRQHRTQNLQKTYTAYCKFCT